MIVLLFAVIMPFFLQAQKIEKELDYRPYKFLPQERDYMLFEDNISSFTYLYCENTKKLYFIDGLTTVVEFDLEAAKRGATYKRTITLPLMVRSHMDISPNGKYLAFEDENQEKIHVISVASGKELISAKMGEEFENYRTGKSGEKRPRPCPFAFQSDREILVSGMTMAMLFNIESGNVIKIPLGNTYKDYCIDNVTENGKISGRFEKKSITYEVSNGKLVNVMPGIHWRNDIEFYVKRCDSCEIKYTYYSKKTGVLIQDRCSFCDESGQYEYRYRVPSRDKDLIALKKAGHNQEELYLVFPEARDFFWIDNVNLFCVRYKSKIQVFNHDLTKDEIEKQLLLSIIESKDLKSLDDFIAKHPNSKYTGIAKQKRQGMH